MKADKQQFIRTIEIRDRTGRVIGTKDVVTYQGLLSRAHEEGLVRVSTSLAQIPSDENGRTAIAKAEVQTSKGTFEALGDASPESVSSFLAPHLIRMAETRAKARALRDAVNVGVVSFEELDGEELPAGEADLGSGALLSNGPGNGSRRRPRPILGPAEPLVSMTESQRRFLFRLMAAQGLQQEAAHERLLDLLGVESLTAVSKEMASSLIDELQSGSRPRGESPNASRGAPLQR